MNEGLSGVMGRIRQIRSVFGAGGGPLGVSIGGPDGFEQMLRTASSTRSKKAYTPSNIRKFSASDPLERVAIPKGTRATSRPSERSPHWPDGVPSEADQYADDFIAAAEATGVPLQVLLAVARAESGFNTDAESAAGAVGIMQLMPGTASGLGVDPTDPTQNILGGARYLAAQFESFGSWELAFAAYNAGPGAVERYAGIPPYRETQNYLDAINEFLDEMTTPIPSVVQTLSTQRAPMADMVVDLNVGTRSDPGDSGVGDLSQQARHGANSSEIGAVNAGAGRRVDAAAPTLLSTPAALGEQLLAQIQRTKANGASGHRLTVRLDPPELGRLDVSFELRGEQVYVVVRPEKTEGAALMLQQRERIAELFAREGLQLSSFDVGTSNQSQGGATQNQSGSRNFIAPNLDLTEVAFTVDRELRL